MKYESGRKARRFFCTHRNGFRLKVSDERTFSFMSIGRCSMVKGDNGSALQCGSAKQNGSHCGGSAHFSGKTSDEKTHGFMFTGRCSTVVDVTTAD